MTQEKSAREELEHWSKVDLDSVEAARQASRLIVDFEAHPEKYTDPEDVVSPFSRIVGLFQQPTAKEAAVTLRAEALPALLRLYDARLREWRKAGPREGYDSAASDLLFVLKIFAMYRGEEPLQRIIDAARLPLAPDSYMWSVVLSALVKAEKEAATRVAAALREPLPPGSIAVALLDMANTLAREHGVTSHPFDTAQGRELLRAFLTDEDPDHFSYAHSAAASLPFLTDSREFFTLAQEHADVAVRMEAAWAAAWGGDALAVARLQDWSRDPKTRKRAVTYLKELGHPPAPLPKEERLRLDAMAEMSDWLEHPSEFGRPPDHLEVYDHRRLFWPPTKDERDVWLLRYRYEDEEGAPEEGVGMVGSDTFALFGETTAEMPPEDIYALHCVWELQQNRDKRAPKELTVEAGRKLLGFPAR
ncbi:MAG TPA: hypothetical protein VEU33_14535 [Archangium sp.]|nr:hypothetical protein [Archangium sp.]